MKIKNEAHYKVIKINLLKKTLLELRRFVWNTSEVNGDQNFHLK